MDFIFLKKLLRSCYSFPVDKSAIFAAQILNSAYPIVKPKNGMVARNLPIVHHDIAIFSPTNENVISQYPLLAIQLAAIGNDDGIFQTQDFLSTIMNNYNAALFKEPHVWILSKTRRNCSVHWKLMAYVVVPGAILHDRYKIEKVIGQGGSGNIYLASDQRLIGRNCAVKQVSYDPQLPENLITESRDQFMREATVLGRLDHPNLPKVSDFFSIVDSDFLVMDYVPGDDLRVMIAKAASENRFLLETEVLNWALQIGDALEYMHTQQPSVVHRDIKPSNIKVTPQGLVKLVDFGLVKVLAPGEVTITILQGQGSATYTPLEQYGGESDHTDARADIYAFGATLYHLLTNHTPPNVRDRFLDPKSLIAPRVLNPAISPRVEDSILWAMQLHPNDRPKDVRTLMKALTGESTDKLHQINRLSQAGVAPSVYRPLMGKLEWRLVAAAGFLTFISLLLTLLRNL